MSLCASAALRVFAAEVAELAEDGLYTVAAKFERNYWPLRSRAISALKLPLRPLPSMPPKAAGVRRGRDRNAEPREVRRGIA